MTQNILKLIAAAGLLLLWLAAIIAKHYWPDIDSGAFVASIISILTGLGVYHATLTNPTTKDAAP